MKVSDNMKDKKNITLNYILPLRTKNLIIKSTTTNDINLILKLDKQQITQKYLGGVKNKTREERILFLKRKSNSLTVFLKNGISIGFIDLDIDNTNNSAIISYIFDYDYCNKGYCTEACKKLIDICFKELHLHSITANRVKGNNSSKRVLEKLKFKRKAISIKNSTEFINYEIYNNKLINNNETLKKQSINIDKDDIK